MRGKSQKSRLRAAYALARSALALAVLSFFGASHALPAVHYAAIAHELCAEHGALHHGEPASQGADHASPSHEPAVSTGDAGEHGHEHCCAAANTPPRAAPPRAPLTGALALAAPLALSAVDRSAAQSSVAVLSYAPKLAPPS